jgi:hypothetical protein
MDTLIIPYVQSLNLSAAPQCYSAFELMRVCLALKSRQQHNTAVFSRISKLFTDITKAVKTTKDKERKKTI